MTIYNIRKKIFRNKGRDVKIICKGSRNKMEIYEGKIDEVYNYIFTIRLDDFSIKSFNFCDVLTKSVLIYNNKKKISKIEE